MTQIRDRLSKKALESGPRVHGTVPLSGSYVKVVEATCQCLLAQAEEGEKERLDEAKIEHQVGKLTFNNLGLQIRTFLVGSGTLAM